MRGRTLTRIDAALGADTHLLLHYPARRFAIRFEEVPSEKCTPAIRLADVCQEHGKNHDEHQIAPGPFCRGAVAGSSAASKGSLDFRDRWPHADLGNQRSHFLGRSVHDRRSQDSTDPSMSGAERSMFQGFPTASGTKEAFAPPHWHVGRIDFGKQAICPKRWELHWSTSGAWNTGQSPLPTTFVSKNHRAVSRRACSGESFAATTNLRRENQSPNLHKRRIATSAP